MRLVLIGPPGAGKGTQAEKLAAHYHIPHVTTGGMIRQEIANQTPLGKRFEQVIAQGDFIPEEEMIALVERRLEAADAGAGYILDGFPRDLAQARQFASTSEGKRLGAVIALQLSGQQVIERLSRRLVCPVCGRSYQTGQAGDRGQARCAVDHTPLVRRPDNSAEAVLHRIAVYERVTAPLLDYYRDCGLARRVDASGEPEQIFRRIVRALAG